MDTFLIPVFIVTCTLLIFLFSSLILYLVPVRFDILLVQKEGIREHSVTVSWGFIRFRIIGGGNERGTKIFMGSYIIYSHAGEGEWLVGEDAKIPVQEDLLSVKGYLDLISRSIAPAGKLCLVLYQESMFEDCTGSVRIGTKDPVATGILYGGYWATRFALTASHIFIELNPEFNREVFEMDVVIRLRVNHPLRIMIAGVQLLITPGFRQGMSIAKPLSGGGLKG